ncbi:hypothetical protein CLU79DRAFT_718385 [Phycomyces nitens]|nr:hypothetical protein CLU79DRAFT_718385 [Phycomyces nitens]
MIEERIHTRPKKSLSRNDSEKTTSQPKSIGYYFPGNVLPVFKYEKLYPIIDIIIRVFKDETPFSDDCLETQIYYSNKDILSKDSDWFDAMLISGMKETEDNSVVIRGVDPDGFGRILQYSYTQKIHIEDINDCINIIKVADHLQFNGVYTKGFDFLKSKISVNSLFDVWRIAAHCLTVFNSPEWLEADGYRATKALKIDNLRTFISETVFFEAAIKWRKAQEAMAEKLYPNDLLDSCSETSTTSNDRNEMDNKLQGFEHKLSQEALDKKKSDYLKEIYYHSGEMIRSVRFTQINKEYLVETVQEEVCAMDVEGIDFLLLNSNHDFYKLAMAYKNFAFSKGIKLDKEYQSRVYIENDK